MELEVDYDPDAAVGPAAAGDPNARLRLGTAASTLSLLHICRRHEKDLRDIASQNYSGERWNFNVVNW